jgi:hypothetical protein
MDGGRQEHDSLVEIAGLKCRFCDFSYICNFVFAYA